MTDYELLSELPDHIQESGKAHLNAIDQLRLAGDNLEVENIEGSGDTGNRHLADGQTLQQVPDNAVSISDRSEAPEGANVITGPRGGLYYVPGGDSDGDSSSTGDMSSEEVAQTAENVTNSYLDRDLSPEANTTEELNNGFCNAVAQEIFEEAGKPDGMQVMEASTMGGRHQWVSYNGRHYDAETPTGVENFEDLPVWERFGEPGEATVVMEGGEGTEDAAETIDIDGTEVAEGSEVEVSIEGSGSVAGVIDEIVEVSGTPWVMVEGEDSGRINQYPITKIDSVDVKELSTARGAGDTDFRCLGEGVTDQELAHAPEWDRPLLEMYRGVTDPDSDPNRALVDFSASGTPEFVLERIREAIMGGALFSDFEDIPSSELMDFRQTFADAVGTDNFTLDSVTNAVMDFGDIDRQRAERIARTETSAVLNSAREDGYQERGEDDALFYWTGASPGDDRQTEACEWLIRQTNPFEGGTPRPMDELRGMLNEAWTHDDEMDTNMARPESWVVHINERSTFSKAPPNWQQL